jgi:hypothetical protein
LRIVSKDQGNVGLLSRTFNLISENPMAVFFEKMGKREMYSNNAKPNMAFNEKNILYLFLVLNKKFLANNKRIRKKGFTFINYIYFLTHPFPLLILNLPFLLILNLPILVVYHLEIQLIIQYYFYTLSLLYKFFH